MNARYLRATDRYLQTMIHGITSGAPWPMARATYAHCRRNGLPLRRSLRNAITTYVTYRERIRIQGRQR